MARNLLVEQSVQTYVELAQTLRLQPRTVTRPGLPIGIAISDYSTDLATVLSHFKKSGQIRTLDALCEVLATEITKKLGQASWLLIAVPSSSSATRHRGFVPAELIAKVLSRKLDDSRLFRNALWHRKWIVDQAALGVESREDNLRNSMSANLRLRAQQHSRVALVDDLITTGASMRECVRALSEIGVEVTAVFALGETLRKSEQRP